MFTDVFRRWVVLLVFATAGSGALAQDARGTVQECVLDASVQERFLPVELLTGLPMPEGQELVFAPVAERTYTYVNASAHSLGKIGEIRLSGPVQWTGEGGVVYEVYERQVVTFAHERFAMTEDKTAIGRVWDERIGNVKNEGKFPVGLWKQGQKRYYFTVYYTKDGAKNLKTLIEIEKLSCTYDGVAGAMQYRWSADDRLEYSYIYAPGRGAVQVAAYKRGS